MWAPARRLGGYHCRRCQAPRCSCGPGGPAPTPWCTCTADASAKPPPGQLPWGDSQEVGRSGCEIRTHDCGSRWGLGTRAVGPVDIVVALHDADGGDAENKKVNAAPTTPPAATRALVPPTPSARGLRSWNHKQAHASCGAVGLQACWAPGTACVTPEDPVVPPPSGVTRPTAAVGCGRRADEKQRPHDPHEAQRPHTEKTGLQHRA